MHDAERASHEAVRTLLLSATPYKMYTRALDDSSDDHYADFLATLDFLRHDAPSPQDVGPLIEEYRTALYGLGDPGGAIRLEQGRDALAVELKRVMVRTERLAVTADRDGMIQTAKTGPIAPTASDLSSYRGMQRLARGTSQPDVMEYWKSAPYLLSYLTDYKVHRDIAGRAEQEDGFRQLMGAQVAESPGLSLDAEAIETYDEIDLANARARWLAGETIDGGLWQLLWLPPTMPYYRLDRPFRDITTNPLTKRLVFSSWAVVPRAVASLLSYEVERRMLKTDPDWEKDAAVYSSRRQRRPLRFQVGDGALRGPQLWTLIYPSMSLATLVDPLALGQRISEGRLCSSRQLRTATEDELRPVITDLVSSHSDLVDPAARPSDWYWAAPILLDCNRFEGQTTEWLRWARLRSVFTDDAEATQEDGAQAVKRAVDDIGALLRGGLKLGTPPKDLVAVLALMALAGPATCALRALLRLAPDLAGDDHAVALDGAASIGWAFRSLFNAEESVSVVLGVVPRSKRRYWRGVLSYCLAGGVQSVLDEYSHLLRESTGNSESPTAQMVSEVSKVIAAAVGLKSAQLRPRSYDTEAKRTDLTLRSLFALPFNDAGDTDQKADRLVRVREAFNSPFRPFVLVTTSVGQEGLDFHLYCHSVVHWNLPSNPVDLEQREGRVHRYKGHAVRKNVARQHGRDGRSSQPAILGPFAHDPWRAAFAAANSTKSAGASDLVPYWIYPETFDARDARIVRHVPFSPLSRDADVYRRLIPALAAYRMVFGQARQDDLVEYLVSKALAKPDSEQASVIPINLEPPAGG